MNYEILKYPRTAHLEGSRLQPGDLDDGIRLKDLPDGNWVWEEKLDGANTGISFDADCTMLMQSRGHVLQGGPRERQFDKLKAWAAANEDMLFDRLGTRFIAYFEWMAAKHTIFYDSLPHLVFEEDIYDREDNRFLRTEERHSLFEDTGVMAVPVLHTGRIESTKKLQTHVRRSLYQTENWREALRVAAEKVGIDPDLALIQTDDSDRSEGLYLKIEDERGVIGRYKWVRASFLQTILDSGSHWQNRPIIENRLSPGLDILAAPIADFSLR